VNLWVSHAEDLSEDPEKSRALAGGCDALVLVFDLSEVRCRLVSISLYLIRCAQRMLVAPLVAFRKEFSENTGGICPNLQWLEKIEDTQGVQYKKLFVCTSNQISLMKLLCPS
jgi:hypothetical protein